jgi:hypothetical protein
MVLPDTSQSVPTFILPGEDHHRHKVEDHDPVLKCYLQLLVCEPVAVIDGLHHFLLPWQTDWFQEWK